MSTIIASAHPRNHFFVEMFTRDLTLTECILDLIDNSIDGLVRTHEINLGQDLLDQGAPKGTATLPLVSIKYGRNSFEIRDSCGGIGLKEAQEEVFNFGHSIEHHQKAHVHQLGVYGIGLKRAVFKLGEEFS